MSRVEWMDVVGFEGSYQISNTGVVKSCDRTVLMKNAVLRRVPGKIMSLHDNSNGYRFVNLVSNGKRQFFLVHRLVAAAFVHRIDGNEYVNHKNGNKHDNSADNLEWVTRKQNINHAFQLGILSHSGEKNSQSKLTEESIAIIRQLRKKGERAVEIANKFGISRRRIYDIVNLKGWKHV